MSIIYSLCKSVLDIQWIREATKRKVLLSVFINHFVPENNDP